MKRETVIFSLCLTVLLCLLFACSTPTKLENIQKKQMSASLALSRSEMAEERRVIQSGNRDTIRVTDAENGNELILMKAIKDDETGEMVANEVIDAAVITARFRNVAERHGKVDLRFEVLVPQEMFDTRWQIRLYPDMFIMEDSVRLQSVILTGADYRKEQLRGYELYDKYLRSIITDTTLFIDRRNLDIWISRNVKELAKYKDSQEYVYIDERDIVSFFGPTVADAVRHYTLWSKRHKNEYKWSQRGKKFEELVKAPIVTDDVRLDTVMRDAEGNFVYQYTQTINTRPKLRKVDIVLSGEIFESDKRLYTMPRTEPLTFYISSLSAFVDQTERYLSRVIERKAAANTACYVDFAVGKADIDMSLGHNEEEMGRIRGNILQLMQNEKFDLDSIVIAASASPEGNEKANGQLAEHRAASVAKYFDGYIKNYRDSVQRELNREARNSFSITVGDDGVERAGRVSAQKANIPDIRFLSRSNGENWPYLSVLVDEDTVMTAADKRSYVRLLEISNVDEREKAMQAESYYRYMRENLYPRLRTVRFDFFLHRRGMIKDTVHTTVLDSTYMQGVQYLKDREYKLALDCLRDYRDYNTAIAYVSLDYNASAMDILKDLPKTAQVNYMLALLYARNGDDQKAVQHYMDACKQERSYVFRGNLDPEIYVLIQRYGLNKEDDLDF